MSVLLSWHEKVRHVSILPCSQHKAQHIQLLWGSLVPVTSFVLNLRQLLTTAIARGSRWTRQRRQGYDGPPHSLSGRAHTTPVLKVEQTIRAAPCEK